MCQDSVCVALLSIKYCLSTVKECDLAAVQSPGRCTVCHFAHARPAPRNAEHFTTSRRKGRKTFCNWGERERAPIGSTLLMSMAIMYVTCTYVLNLRPSSIASGRPATSDRQTTHARSPDTVCF